MTATPRNPDPVTDGRAAFRGWPADGLTFLAELERDNSRAFWTANRHRYQEALLEPTHALAAALAEEFGPPRVFRPHVDRRFRPGVAPYRTDTGATVAGPGGTPYTVVLAARGLSVQVGYQAFDPGQLRRYRHAVDGGSGEELVRVLAALHGEGLGLDGVPVLRGRPRGCPRDHPRLPLMRLRGLHVDRAWPAGDWLATGEALDRVREAWRAARPLVDWLDAHVGRRTEPGPGRRSPAASAGPGRDAGARGTAGDAPAHPACPEEVDGG
jgi:uncharacterized protein (DUF2461 family)